MERGEENHLSIVCVPFLVLLVLELTDLSYHYLISTEIRGRA